MSDIAVDGGTGGFLVIGTAAVRIPKDGEGPHDAFQLGGHGFPAVQVGVVCAHQGTVGAGDLPLRRTAGNVQHRVVIRRGAGHEGPLLGSLGAASGSTRSPSPETGSRAQATMLGFELMLLALAFNLDLAGLSLFGYRYPECQHPEIIGGLDVLSVESVAE
jgi:hypothetical protein